MSNEAAPTGQANAQSSTPTLTQTSISSTNFKKSPSSKRIEVENLANDLQEKLGSSWDNYQTTISSFLVGKLSRKELTLILNDLLVDPKMVRMHNQLLLANLANALRDGPNSQTAKSGFGSNNTNKKKKNDRVKASSQYEKLKKDIMALPIRERHRIKTLTRESGKTRMVTSMLTATRQSLLPKVPFVTDQENKDNIKPKGNTAEWTQDITHALQSLLGTETYSLPDMDVLKTRMLGIAREHGLIGNISKDALDIVYLGLETYLKQIIDCAIDTVRYRRIKYSKQDYFDDAGFNEFPNKRQKRTILTAEDMFDCFNLFPFLVEENGPICRLNTLQLNDDCHVENKAPISDLLVPKNQVMKEKYRTDLDLTNRDLKKGSSSSDTNANDSSKGINDIARANVGTRDELNWLIHDIISAQ